MNKVINISLLSIVSQSKGNAASDMDGERVLMNIKNSKYYNLGRLGGVIWDLIEAPISINNLVNTLTDEYEVDRRECEAQVVAFLENLNNEGLIIVQDAD